MDKKNIAKEYSNDEITIVWKPGLCEHAGVCVRSLPKVYTPKDKPWIHPYESGKEELIKQINNCPSGALSYKLKEHLLF